MIDTFAGRLGSRQPRARRVGCPRPPVAEPERGEDLEVGRLRTAVLDGDADQDVFGGRLCVLDEDVEISIVVEDAGVEQLVLRFGRVRGARFRRSGRPYGKCRLRILVQELHVRVRRRAVQIEVALLDVLAVVALMAGQAEEALLEDRIPSVPERERQSRCADADRRCRRARPRSSDRRAIARDRAEKIPRRSRRRCSLREPFPRPAR